MLGTLKSRVLLVLVVWLAAAQLASLWLYARKHEEAATLLQDALVADRLALTTRLLDGVSETERRRLVEKLSSPLFEISAEPATSAKQQTIEGARPHIFEHLVGLFLDRPDHWGIQTTHTSTPSAQSHTLLKTLSDKLNIGPHHLPAGTLDEIRPVGRIDTEIATSNGILISARTPLLSVSPFSIWKLWAPLSALLLSVLISGAWVLSRATLPLATLADAAERLGHDIHARALPERGASEVQIATRAFNAMQARIKRLVEDRTAFAAALAHDIGTPITRLMLRLDDLPDGDTRSRMAGDVEQMQRMIQATLNFARMDFQAEAEETFDLATLLHSIADTLSNEGNVVHVHAPPKLLVTTRPVTLRRAMVNIIENAIKYGGDATITLREPVSGRVTIVIDDHGPGIADALKEEAFRPFRRLTEDPSTEGTGLGLSVARAIARSLGGDVTLENRAPCGLRVQMSFRQTM